MSSSNAFDKILAAASKAVGKFEGDDRYWKAELDKVGNGSAEIRFLLSKNPDDVPFVKIYDHGFQGPTGKWLIEHCPTTIGKECPVCEANGTLWNSGIDSDKEIVRKRKRKVSFITNILVVNDPKNPDNNGQVKLFKFGPKIFQKLLDAMQPTFEDENPINPFDLKEGANFKLKIRKVEGYANFDKSEFTDPSSLSDHDIQAFNDKLVDLNAEFMAADKYKSYNDLKERMFKILTEGVAPQQSLEQVAQRVEDITQTFTSSKVPEVAPDDVDEMKYFQQLAESDLPF